MKLLNRKSTYLGTIQIPRSQYAGALLGWQSWNSIPGASIWGTDYEEDMDHEANQEGIIHQIKTGAQETGRKDDRQKG